MLVVDITGRIQLKWISGIQNVLVVSITGRIQLKWTSGIQIFNLLKNRKINIIDICVVFDMPSYMYLAQLD